jgi:hypothetical protein
MEIATEEACVELCKETKECQAVNYFTQHQACLLFSDTKATDPSIESREEQGAVYVNVKECGQQRRKRDASCKLEGVLVGGSIVTEKGYIENVASEEACIEECNKLEKCNAINYWADLQACLPQEETLAGEGKDGLASREEPGIVYVVVKGCNGPIEKPANILPPVDPSSQEPGALFGIKFPLFGNFPFGRKKRDANCKKEKTLVGGTLVGEQLEKVETEQACVDACNKLDKCQAINYFPQHKVCWPQEESLNTDKDLATREDELTDYIIVKGCGGNPEPQPNPEPEPEPEPEPQPEPENPDAAGVESEQP